jgi:hypothetical protein
LRLLETLTRALDARDPDASAHANRVAILAEALARRLGWRDASLEPLRLGGTLHDLGKLTVPRRLLLKRSVLTPVELARVREHPRTGARLLAPIALARPVLPYVLFHHERWDGGGYPTGRSGAEIPLGARVLAVVDAFDAMTSDRPYRRALSVEAALEEIDRCAGAQFDPVVARVFVGAWLAGEITIPARSAVALRLIQSCPGSDPGRGRSGRPAEAAPEASDPLAGDFDDQEQDGEDEPEREDPLADVDAVARGDFARRHIGKHHRDRGGTAEGKYQPDPTGTDEKRGGLGNENERRYRQGEVVMPGIHNSRLLPRRVTKTTA